MRSNEVNWSIHDRAGNHWIGSGADLGVVSKFDGANFTHYGAAQGVTGGSVWAMHADTAGQIWVATSEGLSRFDGQNFAQIAGNADWGGDDVNQFAPDGDALWLATRSGLLRYANGNYARLSAANENQEPEAVTTVFRDSRGYRWTTVRGAVRVFDGTNTYEFDQTDGFATPHLYTFAEDHRGNLWLGTKRGVYLLDLPPDVATDPTRLADLRIESFHRADGLKGEDIRLGGLCVTADHYLWMSTGKGLARLNLDEFYANRTAHVPSVRLNGIALNGVRPDFYRDSLPDVSFAQTMPFNGPPTDLSVPHDVNHLTFHFTGFDWAAPHDLRYQYLLDGLETGWSAPTATPQVDYRSVPPGAYTFRVRARGRADVWSEPTTYAFRVLPPWWQTGWAYLGYVALVLALLYGVFEVFRRRWLLKNELAMQSAEARRLLELDAFKKRLFTNLTHEFRTPLTVILGMVDQVRSRPDDYLTRGTRIIERNGRELLRLVNQMLDLAKLEDRSFRLHWQHTDILPYLSYLTESFRSYAERKNLALRFDADVVQQPMDFDAEQIKQVLGNLIANAVKFTPEHGRILVRVSVANEELQMEVRDSGVGIAPEHLPHVFDRFYQIDTRENTGGTGIGLAHTQELVTLMGGRITVESEVGWGTSFRVFLPIRHTAAAATELPELDATAVPGNAPEVVVKSATEVTPPKNAPLVLLVEDNPDVVTYLISCLEGTYRIQTASNGRLGFAAALEHVPDLIVSDVMMPEMNGYDLCAKLKSDARTSHIPVVLLTARVDAASKMEGLRRGADVYLPKPFDREELFVRLEQMVRRQEKLRSFFAARPLADATPLPDSDRAYVEVEHVFVRQVRAIVEEHYADERFGLPQLCQKLNMSRTQVYRKMKALMDVSPSKFIRSYRLECGKTLLETTDATVSEVAWQVGFRERSHFSKAFHDEFGHAPSGTAK